MSQHDRLSRFHAYLLRCWQERSERPEQPTVWRFSLEDSSTHQRHGFASLEALVDFLKAELASDEDPPITKDE